MSERILSDYERAESLAVLLRHRWTSDHSITAGDLATIIGVFQAIRADERRKLPVEPEVTE